MTPEISVNCFWYLLWLRAEVCDIENHHSAIRASDYWVCDGIIPEGHFDKAWEVSAALLQELQMEDIHRQQLFGLAHYKGQEKVWQSVSIDEYIQNTAINPELTSFFLDVHDHFSRDIHV